MELNYRMADLSENEYVAQYVYDDEEPAKNKI